MDEEYFYVTKWALTNGVLLVPRSKAKVHDGKWISWGKYFESAHGADWHESREAAEARVRVMKERKRESLHKSLAKLDRPVRSRLYDEND